MKENQFSICGTKTTADLIKPAGGVVPPTRVNHSVPCRLAVFT